MSVAFTGSLSLLRENVRKDVGETCLIGLRLVKYHFFSLQLLPTSNDK